MEWVRQLHREGGLTPIPVSLDGLRRPLVRWSPYQDGIVESTIIDRWFGTEAGIAILTGKASGWLEVIDFDFQADVLFPAWLKRLMDANPTFPGRMPIMRTPKGGYHVWYRCRDMIGPNQKLAMDPTGAKVKIETRGQGGVIYCPGSPPRMHPRNATYDWLSGDLLDVPVVTSELRYAMLWLAKQYNEFTPPPEPERPKPAPKPVEDGGMAKALGLRPGDRFNKRATWEQILEPHGWTLVRERGDVGFWRKPDASGPPDEHQATTGACGDRLFCFTPSAPPFKEQKSYDKFEAYTLLSHGGDHSEAAQAIRRDLLREDAARSERLRYLELE